MAAKVKLERAAWWLIVHLQGRRKKIRFGPTKGDKARATRAAQEINHRLALGQYQLHPEREDKPEPVPFDQFARNWLIREVEIPIERELEGQPNV